MPFRREVSETTRRKLSAARKGKPWPGRVRRIVVHISREEWTKLHDMSQETPFPGDVDRVIARLIHEATGAPCCKKG